MATPLRTWIDAQPEGRVKAIEALAEKTGFSVRAIYRYASGERSPSLADAAVIARATGIPGRDLLGAEDLAALSFVAAGAV